ncbi:IclR family transcriptional regulator [Psychrobacillus vulpis]|uniref:Glycerol operon regulatory protein n=1 Tax=Psychrobacillus vulpis TaxID=2325572 RepID=A0A544TLV3_9BACI|nr:IclR family transcriptional regulator [Psychrobacillus vulpis]TQR18426.1 IclR family transcriptional regulator [Psychrobacillus vulpis]
MRDVKMNSIRSIDRAIDILESFNNEISNLSIDEIVSHTKLAKTTVYRMLYTLEKRGLIRYDKETATYFLGLKLLDLAGNLNSITSLKTLAVPLLIEMQQKTQQTVMMVVPDGDTMIYVFTCENSVGLKYSSYTGQRRSMNYGVIGKIFMAYAEQEQRERLLNLPISSHTKKTVSNVNEIMKQLQSILEQGYHVELEETNPGVHGISAPILDKNNKCIAAIGLLGPSVQLIGDELERCKSILVETSHQISLQIPSQFSF